MRVQLRVYPGSIMFVTAQKPWKDTHHDSEGCEGSFG